MRRLLLDIGGVVIRTPFELLDAVGSPDWRGPFDPDNDPLWRSLQAGEITEREHWDRRARQLYPRAADPVWDLMNRVFEGDEARVVRPEVAALVAEVGAGALTNDLTRFHSRTWVASKPTIARLDPIVDLSYLGVLKPAPGAYAVAVERLETTPGGIVFVDDQPANVAAAEAAGLVAVWFDVTDPAGSLERVRARL